jgi:predicted nucleotidyltransferase component of viral defense system
VDITISEVLCFPIEPHPVLRAYPEFSDLPEDRAVSVYSLNEIAAEKVVALQDRARNETRDLYDLWFLTVHAGVDPAELVPAIQEKLRFRQKEIARLVVRISA